jgi:hypothetical protein
MTEKFDPDAIRNPSTGLLARNPTHIAEAKYAADQSDIVKAIKDTGVKRMIVTYNYAELDGKNLPPLMGIMKIREMTVESAIKFCQSLMRHRPNIFKVHIKLGSHQGQKRIDNGKTRLLNSNKPRFHTEIAEKLGEVLADRNMNVTEIKYTVHNADPGYFSATAEVYGTSKEEYYDDSCFSPVIEFEFIKTT